MNCEQAEELFLDFVEGGLDESTSGALKGHFQDCPSCRLRVQETRHLIEAMHRAKDRQERAGLTSAGGPGRSAPSSWGPGTRLGDFEIQNELGRGGMGVVFRARQVSLNRVVALKVLAAGLGGSPSGLARFRKEAQAAAKLHHTNIVPVYAQGEQDGHLYYAMELVEGRSLDRYIRDDAARLSPPGESISGAGEASGISVAGSRRSAYRHWARLISGVAEGLEHAHRQNVIHRDIKPQNLLLAPDGQLHITDFGLARLLDEPSLTLTGEMVGTPAYMSPEQIRADRQLIDHRTDIYSLGVTLYEALTGHRPFEAPTRDQLVAMICAREPKPLRRWDSHIPVDLETLCLRAMEKEPSRRYQRAGELAADLRRFVEFKPIAIRRAGPVEKTIKWVRRHPALATIYGLLFVVLAGSVLWRVQTVRARHARADELVSQAFGALAYEDYRESAAAARETLQKAAPLGPDESRYRIALALANLRGEKEDKIKAMEGLKSLCAEQPRNTEAMYLLAWALRPMRREEAGRDSLEWIRRADAAGGPATAAAHFFRGQAIIIRDADEAVRDFRSAVVLRRNYTQAMLHLGRAQNYWMYHFRRLERLGDSKEHLGSACNLDPDRAYPRYLLSIAYRLAGEIAERDGNTTQAEEYYSSALATAKDAQSKEADSAKGYLCEAEYWESRHDHERAILARDQAAPRCKIEDDIRDVHRYRWRLRYWLGDLTRAEGDLGAMAAVCATDDPLRIWYTDLFPALLLADRGQMAVAIPRARRPAEAKPGDFRAVTSSSAMLRILQDPKSANDVLALGSTSIDFAAAQQAPGDADWLRTAFQFCRVETSLSVVGARCRSAKDPSLLLAPIYFFDAANKLAAGDRPGALSSFRLCEQTHDYEDYCYLAKVFVRRMEADPAWPPWIPSGG